MTKTLKIFICTDSNAHKLDNAIMWENKMLIFYS